MRLLDVGCGYNTEPGYWSGKEITEIVRMDAQEAVKPDILHDITTVLPDELLGAFDAVQACHVLEHVSYWKAFPVLKNIISAVRPGGEVLICVPDMEWAAHEILEGRETRGLMGHIYGGHSNEWDYHRCGFTRRSLAVLLANVGVIKIETKITAIEILLNEERYRAQQVVAHGIKE